MREVLFRGKRIDNGEWIEGYLVKLGRESFSDPERYGICNKAIPIGGSGVCYNLKIDEVIPKTVGQFTGLTDKNGKKIFEGDILRIAGCYFDVIYRNGGFVWRDMRLNKFVNYANSDSNIERFSFVEVIGNIHDNPELLKGNVE